MNNLILIAKDLMVLFFYTFIGSILLYFISHLIMGVYKTIFCDAQVKLFKTWWKKFKREAKNDLEKVQKKF